MHSIKTIFLSAFFFSICGFGAELSQAQDPFELSSSLEVNFAQWREKYQDFAKNNQALLTKDMLREFLNPLVQELHLAYANGKICEKKMSFEFNLYEPRNSSKGLKWKKSGHEIIRFDPAAIDQIIYRTFGRDASNEIRFESTIKSVSRLHLIFIPAGDELLIFDIFSAYGTDIFDPKLSSEELITVQLAGNKFISPFFVLLEPVNLRVAAAKLEIIPLNI